MFTSNFISKKLSIVRNTAATQNVNGKNVKLSLYTSCRQIRGATQNFREFEYTAQTISAMNLLR
jgi:hypothetical protein